MSRYHTVFLLLTCFANKTVGSETHDVSLIPKHCCIVYLCVRVRACVAANVFKTTCHIQEGARYGGWAKL